RHGPPRAGGEESGILQPDGLALIRGVDDRDVAIRIWPVPIAVVLARGARRSEVPLRLTGVLGLEQQAHLDRRERRVLEARGPFDEIGARRPREVVDVLLVVAMCRRIVGVVVPFTLDAGGAERPPLRNAH